jgi:hypothetical protein
MFAQLKKNAVYGILYLRFQSNTVKNSKKAVKEYTKMAKKTPKTSPSSSPSSSPERETPTRQTNDQCD